MPLNIVFDSSQALDGPVSSFEGTNSLQHLEESLLDKVRSIGTHTNVLEAVDRQRRSGPGEVYLFWYTNSGG